jgi:hypothetical protein
MRGMRALVGTAADMSSLDWALGDDPRRHAARSIAVAGRGGGAPPAWADAVVARVRELARLETVNPAVARPLNEEDVIDALRFMERVMREDTCPPWIGRLSSGGVELAWRHDDVEVEAIFDRLRGDYALIVEVGDREWDAPADQADSLFASVVDRLSYSYIGHVSERPATACA